MSREILSQDEIDSLLKGVQSGDIRTEAGPADSGARAFDFRSQERIIRGRMPGLEIANERFARFFRNSVSNLIRRFADVNIHGVDMMKFGDFMRELPLPSAINIVRMKPLKGCCLLVVEAPLVFAFVECFFGGTSVRQVKAEGRRFTSIEQKIIRKVVEHALSDMSSAWKGIAEIAPEYVGCEINPQFVTIVQPGEVVIRVRVHVELDDFVGRMAFAIPYSVVEPLREKLFSGIRPDKFEVDEHWVQTLKERLLDAHVELVTEVGRTALSVGELAKLRVGHVLHLGVPVSGGVVLKVEGVPKFRGRPGVAKGSQAVRITEIL